MKKFPKIKETVASYIMSEEGKIAKQSLITMGAFLGGAALASFLQAETVEAANPSCFVESGTSCGGPVMCGGVSHCNNVWATYDGTKVRGHHSHHSSY